MCGISGIVGMPQPQATAYVSRMLDEQYHRGPDAQGVWSASLSGVGICLGSRRLSIRDTSPAGHQPMANETNDVHIAYNGELYNEDTLRHQLQNLGHSYRSNSDTETLIHAYEEFGMDFLKSLNGMYAFAICDQRSNSLYLARDRHGIKPLYYAFVDDALVFASELKAITAAFPALRKDLDWSALCEYLALAFIPSPRTPYSGISKLMPGSTIRWSLSGVSIAHSSMPPVASDSSHIFDVAEEVRSVVTQAIEDQLVSDVPVGVLLSGGVDSSIIAMVAARASENPVYSYTVRYDTGASNRENADADGARELSRALGTHHQEITIGDGEVSMLPQLSSTLDEPLAEATSVSLWAIGQQANRDGVRVLLSGDGGDEAFLGYGWYKYARFIDGVRRNTMLRLPFAVSSRIPSRFPLPDRLRKLTTAVTTDTPSYLLAHYNSFGLFGPEDICRILHGPICSSLPARLLSQRFRNLAENAATDSRTDVLNLADQQLWVGDHFNHRLDRVLMAHSVEGRVPFQSEAILRMVRSLQMEVRLPLSREPKHLQRLAFEADIPVPIWNRPKLPFVGPYVAWLQGPLRDLVIDTLADSNVQRSSVLRGQPAVEIRDAFLRGDLSVGPKVLSLLQLQLWLDTQGA